MSDPADAPHRCALHAPGATVTRIDVSPSSLAAEQAFLAERARWTKASRTVSQIHQVLENWIRERPHDQ